MSHNPLLKKSTHMSANEVLSVAEKVTGEDKTPSMPHSGLLHMIAEIRKAEKHGDDDWSDIVKDQLRFLKAALKLCQTSPLIGIKFGSTIEGAAQLVGILKARAAEMELEEAIDSSIEKIIPKTGLARFAKASAKFQARKDERVKAGTDSD
jgi:hypothetical protein